MDESETIHPVAFPGGIADAEGGHACVRDRAGRLVAIALERGALLWRSAQALRPLVIARGEVIALRTPGPAVCAAFPMTGAEAGSEGWASEALPLPAWADPGNPDPAEFSITAALRGSSILVSWRARTRYRGGAAPGKDILKRAARDEAGSVAVDRASGKVARVPAAADLQPPPAEPGDAAAPDTVAQRKIGARRYELAVRTQAHSVQTVLRALELPGGALAWETVIDEGAARAPRPPRPRIG